jgi:hypothetical protein
MALSRVFEPQKPKPNCMIVSGVSSVDINFALYEFELRERWLRRDRLSVVVGDAVTANQRLPHDGEGIVIVIMEH